jgi:hypothetical protein
MDRSASSGGQFGNLIYLLGDAGMQENSFASFHCHPTG